MRTLIALLFLGNCLAPAESSRLHGNPIRRIVTMLEEMAKSVEREGETDKELHEKFLCYCKKTDADLAASLDAGSTKTSELESAVEEDTATKAQMDQDVTQHKADREAAQKAVEESTAMRGKEAAEFAASSGEMKANVQAMTGALEALKKGLSASLLQTSTGAMLKNIVQHTPLLTDTQREIALSYLQSGEATEGGSDQIIGIVEQMKESMEADLKEATESENQAKGAYDNLMKAKGEEIQAATKGIETKMARSGELAVAVATNSADLESTKESFAEDTAMRANLGKSCAQKSKEFDARQRLMTEEVTAISETIKILNSDDSLDLFKKTLPSGGAGAFVQTASRSKYQMKKFSEIFNKLAANDQTHTANYKMILLQTKSKAHMGNFEHIAKMIDDMIKLLGNEQADDDKQKGFCDGEIEKAGDEKAATEGNIKEISAKMAELQEVIDTVSSEVATLKDGIAALDTSVAQATDMRKKEHAEFSSTAAQNQAALELLDMAKNRMNKFYNPTMYKTTTTAEPSIYGLIQDFPSLVQVSLHSAAKDFDEMQNMQFGEYKKSQASGGIIQMLDQMMGDVEAEMAEAKRDEEDGQKEYEETMADATAKRATDQKLIVTKEASKAELVSKLDEAKSDKGDASTLLSGLVTKIADLHQTCDFLLENYDFRRDARTSEIEGLHEGKAVLSGADLGFMQKF